jgi:hypothetical protein
MHLSQWHRVPVTEDPQAIRVVERHVNSHHAPLGRQRDARAPDFAPAPREPQIPDFFEEKDPPLYKPHMRLWVRVPRHPHISMQGLAASSGVFFLGARARREPTRVHGSQARPPIHWGPVTERRTPSASFGLPTTGPTSCGIRSGAAQSMSACGPRLCLSSPASTVC